MQILWAQTALTSEGWQSDVRITIDDQGHISGIKTKSEQEGACFGVLLPAISNLHSHAFQRAMAGMTENGQAHEQDNFWSWRKLMYRFLHCLTPEDIESIAAFAQMEMLEAGYAAVAEFHYLHHRSDGAPYDNLSETSERIAAAAAVSGIGLTLLPVLYERGGCDGRPLDRAQARFGNDLERFAELLAGASSALSNLPADAAIGVAPHSLRAVSPEGLRFAVGCAPEAPIHMHVAEQTAEVDEIHAALGARPVEWLLENHDLDEHWCLIHATHMSEHETKTLAESGAIAGLCPSTEANLGDGVFNGKLFAFHQGRFGIGTDANIKISVAEELRLLEYSQRLRDRTRAVLSAPQASTGRVLLDSAAQGGARALNRASGAIATGFLADLVALDAGATNLLGKKGDQILDAFIFAGPDSMITDVWSAGRHVVRASRHRAREAILSRYRNTILSLGERI